MIRFNTYKTKVPVFFRVTEKTDRIRGLLHSESASYIKTYGYFPIGYIKTPKNEWKSVLVGEFTTSTQVYASSYYNDDLSEIHDSCSEMFAGSTFISEEGMNIFLQKIGRISRETFKFLHKNGMASYLGTDLCRGKINFLDYEYKP